MLKVYEISVSRDFMKHKRKAGCSFVFSKSFKQSNRHKTKRLI